MRLSIGGPCLGILFGIFIVFWMKRIQSNAMLEVNLTIFSSYLLFYTAEETSLKVSGILAMVAMGLYMSRKGKTSVSSNSHEFIHNIWTYLGFIAETLIFLFAGYTISSKVIEDPDIKSIDYLKCILLYAFLHVIRYSSIFAFWPIINLFGYGLDKKEIVVLGFAGLRGALALVLALILSIDERVEKYVRVQVLFHTCGIALLTIIVNGTTTGFIVKRLGLQ